METGAREQGGLYRAIKCRDKVDRVHSSLEDSAREDWSLGPSRVKGKTGSQLTLFVEVLSLSTFSRPTLLFSFIRILSSPSHT